MSNSRNLSKLGFSKVNLEDVLLMMLSIAKMEVLRLLLLVYLLRNHLGVKYEYPPWYSSEVWNALSSLMRNNLVSRQSGAGGLMVVSITSKGLSRVNELIMSLGDSMVMPGPALIIRLKDLRARISEMVQAYAGTPLRILASVALSDAAHERYYLGSKSPLPELLWEASRVLAMNCEGSLG